MIVWFRLDLRLADNAPWLAPPEVLVRAGVALGRTYPLPIVDHRWARARALVAFDEIKGGAG